MTQEVSKTSIISVVFEFQVIQLTSQSLEVALNDTLYVYDGPTDSSQRLADVGVNITELALNSTGTQLLLYLTSDTDTTSSSIDFQWKVFGESSKKFNAQYESSDQQ